LRPAFELAVQDTDGVAVAARLGVDRIELCAALPLGGVTPSQALIEFAAAGPPAHVLVRPRTGGFDYTPDEVGLIAGDHQKTQIRRAIDDRRLKHPGYTGVMTSLDPVTSDTRQCAGIRMAPDLATWPNSRIDDDDPRACFGRSTPGRDARRTSSHHEHIGLDHG